MKHLALATSDEPRVSVLVLSMRDPGMLRRCLTALGESTPSVPHEVLVLVNGGDPAVTRFVRKVAGVRTFVSDVNLGFGGGNDHLIRHARGELLLLLNDDAELAPGAIEALVDTIDRHPDAAAVGSRIEFPDGTLQECGSVIFCDGSTAPVGRGLPPGSTEHGYLRRVDYASANGLLVRRAAYDEVGGFDPEYFPAYYEDVDLCLALQQAGHVVLVDPRARLRHLESASSTSSFKALLFERNGKRFREKWADALALLEPGEYSDPAAMARGMHRARGNPRRVLLVDDMLPSYGMGAGFGRMLDLVRELAYDRYAITFLSTNHPDGDPSQLASLGLDVLPCRPRPDIDEQAREHLADALVHYDAVVVSRPHNWEIVAPHVRALQPQALLVYDAEALFHRRLEQQAAMADDDDLRAALTEEARLGRALEARIASSSDWMVCVSSDEAEVVRSFPGHCPVSVVEPLQPELRPTPRGWYGRRDMALVASWIAGPESPNVDGLRWFVDEVLPHIVREVPWAQLKVTGKAPPETVQELESGHVHLLGFVEDLDALYDSVRVVVSPIRFGAGVKIKTIEALQHAVPTVTTSHGAEGIRLGDVDGLDVADDPVDFARRVVGLLTERDLWEARREALLHLGERWQASTTTSWRDVLAQALDGSTSGTTSSTSDRENRGPHALRA